MFDKELKAVSILTFIAGIVLLFGFINAGVSYGFSKALPNLVLSIVFMLSAFVINSMRDEKLTKKKSYNKE